MKRYTRSDIELKFPFKETTTEYYLADDVADLARRGIKYLQFMLCHMEARDMLSTREKERIEEYVAELEQITGK